MATFILQPMIFYHISTIIFIFVAWNSVENFWTTFFSLYKIWFQILRTHKFYCLHIRIFGNFSRFLSMWFLSWLCLCTVFFQQWGYEKRAGQIPCINQTLPALTYVFAPLFNRHILINYWCGLSPWISL